MFLYPLES